MLFIYRLLLPLAFLFFRPGLIVKLIRRSGRKKNFAERFGIFAGDRREALGRMKGCIWFHAVSVGETNVALSLLKKWVELYPEQKFVFSTTTTTAQEIAWNKVPQGVEVFFCPVDFSWIVRKVLKMIRPSALVIFETEIWPNLVTLARKSGAKVFLANGRISDHSAKGYSRLRFFFAPVLKCFDRICVQTVLDQERFCRICPAQEKAIVVTGNIKFDQAPSPDLKGIDLSEYFGSGDFVPVLACSTHSPEEKILLEAFLEAKKQVPALKFVIVPRHAERGHELERMLLDHNVSYHRRTSGKDVTAPVDCLLADTTGELVKFIASSRIILMGKTFGPNREGQNIIEPASMGKAVITGPAMLNFKQAFAALKEGNGVLALEDEGELASAIIRLAQDPACCNELGSNAEKAVALHRGASVRTIELLEKEL